MLLNKFAVFLQTIKVWIFYYHFACLTDVWEKMTLETLDAETHKITQASLILNAECTIGSSLIQNMSRMIERQLIICLIVNIKSAI